ncbi:MAG: hypothetical protein ACP5G4_04760 [bacterium]
MESAPALFDVLMPIGSIVFSLVFLIALLHIFPIYRRVKKNTETLDKMAEQMKDLHRHVMPEDGESASDDHPKKNWPERRERK